MKLLVLPGDGIGPEITDATLEVLQAASQKFSLGLRFEQRPVGLAALKAHGTTLPDGLLGQAAEADGVILGPLDQLAYPPREKGGINVSGLKLETTESTRRRVEGKLNGGGTLIDLRTTNGGIRVRARSSPSA